MSQPTSTPREIFLSALDAPPEERAALLDSECAGDSALRRHVEDLLRVHDEPDSLLDSPRIDVGIPKSVDAATMAHSVSEQSGAQIGPYKLLQQIGEGGMGVVYMAEQTDPIERRVALKIIKPGMDTRQVIARFEAERQALAMMDHPNIAKVLDAGVTNTGRPYFVMELVKGTPITEYCDVHHLTPRERLELFVPVCQAIQHAHQKGIIHRDIKPSNVLVADYDDHPVPKVIDFGVAKAIDHRLTEKTLFTEFGQVLGTIEYMSPEQAKLNQWDVDTRTDIYSLGVLLYELLAGEVPFDRQRLRSAALDELLRIIREEEPPRPSARASTSHSLPTIAANRNTEPKKLSMMIHGELDWIVMKALEKDRTRRFDTASKFAEDVEHYLNNETVEACPPSAAYRFQKFARRNKTVIGTLAAIAAALMIGTSVAIWQAIEAHNERDRAVLAENAAEQEAERANNEARRANEEAARADAAAKNAIVEATRAERELARAEEVKRLISDMLNGAAPTVTLGADPTVLIKILDDTAERLDAGEVNDELVAAELHWTIGDVYEELGRHERALKHLTQAVDVYRRLKPDHIDTANVISHLGNVYRRLTNYTEAEKQIADALRLSREHDEHSIITADIMGDLASTWWCQGKYPKSEQMYLDSLDILNDHIQENGMRKLLRNHLHNLGSLYLDMGRYSEAKQRTEESLDAMADLDPKDPERLGTLGNLALTLEKLGDYDRAETIQEEVLEGYGKIVDESHPRYLAAKHNLASSYRARSERTGDAELSGRAMGMYQEIIDVGQATGHSPDNAYPVINAKSNLALMLRRAGKLAEAEKLYEEVIDELTSNSDPIIHRYRLGLADVYSAMAKATDDQELLNKAKQICLDVLALESGEQAIEFQADIRIFGKSILLDIYEGEGNYGAAMQMAREIIDEIKDRDVQEQAEPITNPMLLNIIYRTAWMHQTMNECAEAARLYRQVLKGVQGNPAIGPELRFATHANLGRMLLKMKEYDKARVVFENCLPQMRAELPGHEFTENVIRWIAETYENLGEHDKARQYYAEALDLQVERFRDDDHAPTLNHLAWQLLTQQYEQLRDPTRALPLAEMACKIARDQQDEQLWMYLDTLARAQHLTGNPVAAIKTQREAIDLLPNSIADKEREELEEQLQQYESAAPEANGRDADGQGVVDEPSVDTAATD